MAIVSTSRRPVGLGGISAKIGEKIQITEKWVVVSDSELDGPMYVYINAAFPKRGNLYDFGNDGAGYARVRDVDIQCIGGQGVEGSPGHEPLYAWEITCSLDSEMKEEEGEDNPLDRPTEIAWRQAIKEAVFEKDAVTSKPVRNSAGQRFDPPPMKEEADWSMVATRNEVSFDAGYAASYSNRVNSDTFYGGTAGQWKIQGITADPQWDETIGQYYRISYTFAFREDTWSPDILDQGRYEWYDVTWTNIGDPVLLPILDAQHQPVADPWPLDGNGQALPPDDVEAESFQYLEFKKYKEAAFGALGLGL